MDRVVKLFQPGISRVLFNTSGSGKTRLLVEGLCQYWGFYFTPDPHPRLGSVDFSRSVHNVGSYIDAGITFAPNLPNSPNRRRVPLEQNRTIARTVFLSVLLARLLVLEAFLQAGAGIPAVELRRRWTYLQLVPSVLQSQFSSTEVDIFDGVYQTIERHGDNDHHLVNSLIKRIRQDSRVSSISPFFLVLDEAQLCSNQYEGAFHSESDKSPAGNRSVLREIFAAWGRSTLGPWRVRWERSMTLSLPTWGHLLAKSIRRRTSRDTWRWMKTQRRKCYVVHGDGCVDGIDLREDLCMSYDVAAPRTHQLC
ncbi:hypothetical protein BT69DRAFT_1286665 [Atractiella rhizophila]|nr:hypothetical protein BT69DRAFT_1286665 [Atractiella rhizophila]